METVKGDRLWVVAAVPLALMVVLGMLLWTTDLAATIDLIPCVLLVAWALASGVAVLAIIAVRARRGARPFRRPLIWLAAALAALDVLIPVGVVVLAWLVARSMSRLMF